jgi:RNA polymerase sigma-70 factor (ECF subfamily)
MTSDELEKRIRPHHPAAFGWALACCDGRPEEAEDVLQTTYLKILEGRATFNGHSSLRTWLFGVIRKTASEERRRRLLRKFALAREAGQPADGTDPGDPETRAGESERGRLLRRAVAGLSLRQRQVLHLVFYQDLSIHEAGQVLGISVGSARTHYERGKERLRRNLVAEASDEA